MVTLTPDDGSEVRTYQIPYSAGILVHAGDHVDQGQELTAGALSPHDVLRVRGSAVPASGPTSSRRF